MNYYVQYRKPMGDWQDFDTGEPTPYQRLAVAENLAARLSQINGVDARVRNQHGETLHVFIANKSKPTADDITTGLMPQKSFIRYMKAATGEKLVATASLERLLLEMQLNNAKQGGPYDAILQSLRDWVQRAERFMDQ